MEHTILRHDANANKNGARLTSAILAVCLSIVVWAGLSGGVSAGDLPPLQNADIVFQDAGTDQGLAIMLATQSRYTHVGLIERDSDGRPMVIEAVGPVRSIPLKRWIKNGTGGRITIKRMKGLTDSEAARILAKANEYSGRPYDFYFYEGRDEIYCSELVHAAFTEGAEIEVGKVETVSDLNINNDAARALIKERWRRHPLCASKKAASFDACFEKILKQTIVTPASLARDPRLETIYSNFDDAAETITLGLPPAVLSKP